MRARIYPSSDQIESVLIEKQGEQSVDNYYKLEEWADSAPIEVMQAIANLKEDNRDYLIYRIRSQTKAYEEIRCFRNFGWGRLKRETINIIERAGLDTCIGSTTDPEIIKEIIVSQGIETKIEIDELQWR